MRGLAGQLARFGLVGLANTAITLGAFALLHRAGVASAPASALAFLLGAANGYALNRRWTFRAGPASTNGAARYALVQGGAAALDARLTVVLEHALGGRAPAAQAIALVPVSLLAFAFSRGWAFRTPPRRRERPRRPRARRDPLTRPAGTG